MKPHEQTEKQRQKKKQKLQNKQFQSEGSRPPTRWPFSFEGFKMIKMVSVARNARSIYVKPPKGYCIKKVFLSNGDGAEDEAKWITIHPNGKGNSAKGKEKKGRAVLIDGDTGKILGGAIPKKLQGSSIKKIKNNFSNLKAGKRVNKIRNKASNTAQNATSASAPTNTPTAPAKPPISQRLASAGNYLNQYKELHIASDAELQEVANTAQGDIKQLATGLLHDREQAKKANAPRHADVTLGKGREDWNAQMKAKYKQRLGRALYFTSAETKEFHDYMKDRISKSHLGMRMKAATLAEILNDKFRNILELPNKQVKYRQNYKQMRAEFEGKLWGVDDNKVANDPSILPNYGYLANDFENDKPPRLNGYGNLMIHFKKDKVLNNTTFCMSDSFQSFEKRDGTATSKLSDPQLTQALPDKKSTRAFYQKYIKWRDASKTDPTARFDDRYVELQYHGGLRVTDIESVCMTTNDMLDKNTILRLTSMGVKIYVKNKNFKVSEFDYAQIK